MGRYLSDIKLTVLGPFLTASAGGGAYGLDKSFNRNRRGDLVIPASHVKGKIRHALEEIGPYFSADAGVPSIEQLFGVGGDDSDFGYAPAPGMLVFSDLACDQGGVKASRTNVTVDPVSGTAKDHHLRALEDPFLSGSELLWSGNVSFYAADLDAAEAVVGALRAGFRWLGSLGGEKGAGYGRLVAASVGKPELEYVEHLSLPELGDGSGLHLRITPMDPILVGGVKNRRTNFIESQQEFSGGLIKGALAVCLNQTYGVEPLYRKIDADHVEDFPGLEELARNFSLIRISHAFPAYQGKPRPVRVPISAVLHDGKKWDTALCTDPYPLVDGKAPTYPIDWKSEYGQSYFGEAHPEMVYETRSEIDDKTQRSREGQLFTYGFCCPHDEEENPIEWVCNVSFDAVPEAERPETKVQFATAVQDYLRHLGKLSREVTVAVADELAANAVEPKLSDTGDIALIALQSDALMLNPDVVRESGPGTDLTGAYADFWAELTADGGDEPCMELERFYAHQIFRGGYLYHRYLGAGEKDAGSAQYRPYYLTRADSVFKLKIIDRARAQTLIAKWQAQGLSWPAWALAEYGQNDRALWENCPFVPENGFGEIAFNLAWHWDHQI